MKCKNLLLAYFSMSLTTCSLKARDSFGSEFLKGFTGTLKALAPIALDFVKRDDGQVMAREL